MKERAPFRQAELEELDEVFYSKAVRVVALEDVVDGDRAPCVLGLRHDCDSRHSLGTAVQMAYWEAERGYRSSYYLLHTAPYWTDSRFEARVAEIAECGHEIGLHNDALAESFKTGEDPDLILERALDRLRGLGYRVRGSAGHGNRFCSYDAAPGEPWFANDEIFVECERDHMGGVKFEPNRWLWRGKIRRQLVPRPMADFGLDYEALWCGYPFPFRFSDSGGRWIDPGWDETAAKFARTVRATKLPERSWHARQLHILVHPDWWADAFPAMRKAA